MKSTTLACVLLSALSLTWVANTPASQISSLVPSYVTPGSSPPSPTPSQVSPGSVPPSPTPSQATVDLNSGAQQKTSHQSLGQTQLTVRELMHLEGLQALEALRERRPNRGARSMAVQDGGRYRPQVPDDLQLLGIYGVGKRLYAEVRSGARVFRFLKGQPEPLGYRDDGNFLRLHDLSGVCVRLLSRGEPTQLCLSSRGLQ